MQSPRSSRTRQPTIQMPPLRADRPSRHLSHFALGGHPFHLGDDIFYGHGFQESFERLPGIRDRRRCRPPDGKGARQGQNGRDVEKDDPLAGVAFESSAGEFSSSGVTASLPPYYGFQANA